MKYREIYKNKIEIGKNIAQQLDEDVVFTTEIEEAFGKALNSLSAYINTLFENDKRTLPLGMRKKCLLDINIVMMSLINTKKITKKTQKELVKFFKERLSECNSNRVVNKYKNIREFLLDN